MRQFFFIGLFLVGSSTLTAQPTSIKAATDMYLEQMDQKWENARDYTMEVLEQMPETALDYRPAEDQMSFRQQLIHNLLHMTGFSTRYLGAVDFPHREQLLEERETSDRSKAELTELSQLAFSFAQKAMLALDDKSLYETVPFFAGPMNRQQIVELLHDHLTHHRAQMIVYLRLQGIKPPSYRGW